MKLFSLKKQKVATPTNPTPPKIPPGFSLPFVIYETVNNESITLTITADGGFTYHTSSSEWEVTSNQLLSISYSDAISSKILEKIWTSKDATHATELGKTDVEGLGKVNLVELTLSGPVLGLLPKVTFGFVALPISCPLIWKVSWVKAEAEPAVSDSSSPPLPPSPQMVLHTATLLRGSLMSSPDHHPDHPELPTHIYTSSWQSWGFAGTTPKGKAQPRHALPDVFAGEFHRGGEAPPSEASDAWLGKNMGWYSSDGFAAITSNGNSSHGCHSEAAMVDSAGGPSLVLGMLSQKSNFSLVTANRDLESIAVHSSYDGAIVGATPPPPTDFCWLQLLEPHNYKDEIMADYLDALGAHNKAKNPPAQPLSIGWCSWYDYYEKISEEIIVNNLKKLQASKDSFDANVVVVDDGYMTSWGDWDSLKPGLFPSGMKGLASSIKEAGFKPGVWLAPFAADKGSKIADEHPDWIIKVKGSKTKPANSANCAKWFYGLDATNPAVIEHVKNIVRTAVQDWGFEVLKLDFLYASCLKGETMDKEATRAQAYNKAISALREAAGDAFIIGCGAPLLGSVGYVDGMRISADTGPTFAPTFPMPWWDQANLPCLRSMIRNTLTRSPLSHRLWHNDPDCLLLRDTTKLSEHEVVSAITVAAMSSGMLLLSDDLSKVGSSRIKKIAMVTPPTNVPAIPLDLHLNKMPTLTQLICTDDPGCLKNHRNALKVAEGLGTWTVFGLHNWNKATSTVQLPEGGIKMGRKHGSVMDHGHHCFYVWSGKYKYVNTLGGALDVGVQIEGHGSEIVVMKPVVPGAGQYIGSTMHFTCGMEVKRYKLGGKAMGGEIEVEFNKSPGGGEVGIAFFFVPIQPSECKKIIIHINDRATYNAHRIVASIPEGIVVAVKVQGESSSINVVW